MINPELIGKSITNKELNGILWISGKVLIAVWTARTTTHRIEFERFFGMGSFTYYRPDHIVA